MNTWVGIDVGGTFTDVIVYTDGGKGMATGKVPSTPEDPSIAFMNGIELGLRESGSNPSDVTKLVHGSTVGINAFLQRKGARVGLICTNGFEDTLPIGRAKRKQMYDFRLDSQTPVFLCERERTVGIATRLDPNGELTAEASPEEIDRAVEYLVKEQKVDSIAINLLFSYTDPSVEQAIAARIREAHPHVFVSTSSAIDPRVREYERLVVTLLDAYIRPLMSQYVGNLRKKLADYGVTAPLYMMESHGGIIDARLLDDMAVTVLMSGLAGGAIGAAKIGTAMGEPNLLSVDMGGTSTDVALITDGSAVLSDEGVVGGFDVRLPIVDVHTIGAGGGSIGTVDISGGLKVGPESAGADPGPVCYGRGGAEATTTDANVVLGYLPEARLAGGSMSLDRALAAEAIEKNVAKPTGKTLAEAAWAVHRVAVAGMANAARVVSIKRGIDVRDHALFPCGGAGPMHACGIADDLGLERIVVPPFPGVLAAYGLLAADAVSNIWKTRHVALESGALADLKVELEGALASAVEDTKAKAADSTEIATTVTLGMRYQGQSHELDVEVDPADLSATGAPSALRAAFDALHMAHYGTLDDSSDCEITGYKIAATGFREIPRPRPESGGDVTTSETRTAPFYDPQRNDFVDARVVERASLVGSLAGPAIIEQPDTTVVVQAGWEAQARPDGALVLVKLPAESAVTGAAQDTGADAAPTAEATPVLEGATA